MVQGERNMSWKRIFVFLLLIFVIGWAVNIKEKLTFSKDKDLQLEAVSAVLLDADTGKWLYLQNAQQPLPPASMSKMMTEVLVLDGVQSGKFSWEDPVVVSYYAAEVGGAGMGLVAGHSANDAAVALAEFMAGSEAKFVNRMNAKAKEIGLSEDTYFANATGLSRDDLDRYATAAADGDTVMTAKDVALLAEYLIEIHPEVLKVTKKSSVSGVETTELRTTNEMLPGQRFGMTGNDGLKTGYTKEAGYCFTGTTVLSGHRYITVVMGANTPDARFEETKKLLTYGEETFS
jgi:D-alanyl-D-alanine carboxypeptidase (penicillin-binding protein 5/6)